MRGMGWIEVREQRVIVPCVCTHMADTQSAMWQEAMNHLRGSPLGRAYGIKTRSLTVVEPAAPRSSTGLVLCAV